jgi:class 3 adenylate cyclase
VGDETIASVECVKVTGVLTGEAARKAMEQSGSMDSIAAGDTAELDAMLSDINMPMAIWVSKASGDLMRMEMDMAETMTNMMETVLAGTPVPPELEGMDMTISVGECSMVMEYAPFEGVTVMIPEGIAA